MGLKYCFLLKLREKNSFLTCFTIWMFFSNSITTFYTDFHSENGTDNRFCVYGTVSTVITMVYCKSFFDPCSRFGEFYGITARSKHAFDGIRGLFRTAALHHKIDHSSHRDWKHSKPYVRTEDGSVENLANSNAKIFRNPFYVLQFKFNWIIACTSSNVKLHVSLK